MATVASSVQRECNSCHEHLPLDAFRFTEGRRRRSWCRSCEAGQKAEQRRLRETAKLKRLAREGNRLFTAAAYGRFVRTVDEVVREVGGPQRFAEMLWNLHRQMVDARELIGALRLMRLAMQLVMYHGEVTARALPDLPDPSDEEVEAMIEQAALNLLAAREASDIA